MRFWPKVVFPQGFEGCWMWASALTRKGYGRFQVGRGHDDRRQVQAHRFAWELFNGPIPRGLVLCHRCDTPPCVNPGHLFLGTQADNVVDMVTKGRHRHGSVAGEAHPGAKLTAIDVAELRSRRRQGEHLRSLASAYGVSVTQVGRIVREESWAAE